MEGPEYDFEEIFRYMPPTNHQYHHGRSVEEDEIDLERSRWSLCGLHDGVPEINV